jgi:hypothetical protein
MQIDFYELYVFTFGQKYSHVWEPNKLAAFRFN